MIAAARVTGLTAAGDDRIALAEALGATHGIVCFTGAGGKKSAMYRIAAEHPGRIALTSTVHMHPYHRRVTTRVLEFDSTDFDAQLRAAAAERVLAFVRPSTKPGRHGGLSGDQVTMLREMAQVDVCLVKADGARGRRIKAPAPHEPVFPERFNSLVPVVSVRAIGSCLDDRIAHRPERVAAIAGTVEGEILTSEHVARLLAASDGGLKGSNQADTIIPLINMVDTTMLQELARDCALRVLELTARIDRIVLCSLGTRGVVEIVERKQARKAS